MLLLIGTTIETVVTIFLNIIGIFYLIGKTIAHTLINISEAIVSAVWVISECAAIFFEDLKQFASDIDSQYSHIVKVMHNGLTNSIGDITRFAQGILTSFTLAIEGGKHGIQNLMQRSAETFTWSAVSLRNIFVLIGNSAWMLIMFIPNLTIFLVNKLLVTVEGVSVAIGIFVASLGESIMIKCINTVDYFVSIPLQSSLGLLAIYLIVKNRHIAYRIIQYTIQVQINMGSYLAQKCIRFLIGVCLVLQFGYGVCISAFQLRHYRQNIENQLPTNERIISRSANYDESSTNNRSTCDKRNETNNLCVICQDQPKSVVLLPCRHLCLCENCSHHLVRYRAVCPLCRQTFRHTIQVYA